MGNKPRIRFKGFTEDWEQRKLDSLGKIITGNTPSTSKKEYWSPNSDGVVWITPTDINSVKTQCSERLLTKDGASQARIVPANSILVTCIASIGKNTINTVEAAFNQQINALVPHFSNSYFILTMLNNMESAFKRVAGTSATSIINKKEFGQLSALLPEIEEQNKIGRIFELIDNNITLHQCKLEKLKLTKKALLQKLFPKNGKHIPEIRFKGFTDAWEQRKLDDIAKIKTGGGTPKTANPEYWSGNIPWIQSSDLVEGDIAHVNINKFINNNALKNSAAKLISRDSIALVTRVAVGKVAVINQDFTTSQDFLSLSDFDRSDIKFLAYQLYRLMQENAKVLQGTSIKGITKTELIEQSISIPSSGQEQHLISNVLSKIDSIITLHQCKLERLQEVKKGLLQKMFV